MKTKYLIGVDEAGRGPLAGPVAVAAVVLSRHRLDRLLRSNLGFGPLLDSKKLSAKKREQWFTWLKQAKREKKLNFIVSLVGEKTIDRIGIVGAVKIGTRRVLKRLKIEPERCRILLDGGMRAPARYGNQIAIIRGDASVPVIMLASIVAKVRRDRWMVRLAKRYPHYSFEIHKGYGTKKHYAALRQHGLSVLHRRTFLTRFKKSR